MFPDFNGAMSSMSSMMAGGPDGMSEMPPEAASMFSSMMSSEAFRGGMFGSSSPANFASFAAGIVAGDGGGRQRGQGPSTGAAGAAAATSGTEGDSDPDDDCTEPPPLDPDSSPEDGAGAGGEEGGAGKGGTGGGGGDEGDESEYYSALVCCDSFSVQVSRVDVCRLCPREGGKRRGLRVSRHDEKLRLFYAIPREEDTLETAWLYYTCTRVVSPRFFHRFVISSSPLCGPHVSV